MSCGERFAHKSSLSQHRQSHKIRPVLLRLKCNKQYSWKDSLKNHEKMGQCIKKIAKTSWECELCGKTFRRMSSRTRHMIDVQEIPQLTIDSDESEDESLLESVDEMEEISFIGGMEFKACENSFLVRQTLRWMFCTISILTLVLLYLCL